MCSRASSRDDRGMTLVELLLTVTILGIIMSSLAAAVIVMLRTEAPTRDRISESKDVTFLQAWIPTDLASAVSRNVEPTYQPANNTKLPGTNVITITRPDLSNGGTYVTISYRYVHDGDEWQLRRYEIRNPNSTTPTVTQVGVAHELAAPPATWNPSQAPVHAVMVTARNQVVLRPIGEDIDVTFASGDAFTTGGAGLSSEDALPTNYTGGIVDPAAPPSRCGGTVTIVLDTSSSIPTQNGQTALVNAALGFIDAYTGTPTYMRIVGFDVSAYAYYPTTAGQYVNILNPSSALTAMRTKVDAQDTSSGRWGNGTNWEDGSVASVPQQRRYSVLAVARVGRVHLRRRTEPQSHEHSDRRRHSLQLDRPLARRHRGELRPGNRIAHRRSARRQRREHHESGPHAQCRRARQLERNRTNEPRQRGRSRLLPAHELGVVRPTGQCASCHQCRAMRWHGDRAETRRGGRRALRDVGSVELHD